MSILAVSVALIAASSFERTTHGVRVQIPNGFMEVAVTSAGFRIGLSDGKNTAACNTSMIEGDMTYPSFSVVNQSVVSEAGRMTFNNNEFTLFDPTSKSIVSGTANIDSNSVGISLSNDPNNNLYFGSGSGLDDGGMLSATQSYTYVWNEKVYVPHYWSNVGYAAMGVVPEWRNYNPGNSYPVEWNAQSTTDWVFSSTQKADLYLMPSKTMDEGMQQYWTLIGPPLVIPRYAFGYLACRWGWQDRQYIETTLNTFRNESWPIDGWISDFGWFTDVNDYNFPPTGSPTYQDFGYNNATFPQPVQQLKSYRDDLHLRFAGIRKPRLGNTALLQMAQSKGWLDSQGTGDNLRNLNFTIPAVREWYSQINSHYLPDGVNFWWNDEAEYEYFAFYNWNKAQVAELSAYDSNRRFFSLNRAFTPGMQRFGATVWTGDQQSTWDNLRLHPGYLLKWQHAGIGYIACDTGGFSASNDVELLVRWYQVSAFMSIMRVHSTKAVTPHFPFLYGPEAAAAFRFTMNLRYKFIPMIYSLAHKQHDQKIPIFRALMAEWPNDPSVGTNFPWQWLVGSHLMVAPILEQGGWGQVHMPKLSVGVWYQFNTSVVVTQDVVPFGPNTPWETIPMYARSGAILPLAPLVLYTDQLPGGPLDVQVYAGDNGTFTFVEDDGETYDYLKGVKKTTSFSYDDTTKTLSWVSEGSFTGPNLFTHIKMTLFQNGSRKESSVVTLGRSGSLTA